MAPFFLEADSILVKGEEKAPGPGGEKLCPNIPVGIRGEGNMITLVKAMQLGVEQGEQEVTINTVTAWPVVRLAGREVPKSRGLMPAEEDLAVVLGKAYPISKEVVIRRFRSGVLQGRVIEIEGVERTLGRIRWENE